MSKHVVIAGYPRSGTTLFYNMMRNSVEDYEFLDREMGADKMLAVDDKKRMTKRPYDCSFSTKSLLPMNSIKS